MLDKLGEELIDKMMKEAQAKLPACELCRGTLAGGSLTVPDDEGKPTILCISCVFRAVGFYLKERKARMDVTT